MSIIKSALRAGCLLGAIGFAAGFFGPMILMPESNQGPMFGIFISGPGGFLLGLLIGGILGASRRE